MAPTFEFGNNKTDLSEWFVEVVQWRPLPHPGATVSNQLYKTLLPPGLYVYTSIFHPQGKFCFIIQIYNYCGVLLMLILYSKFTVSAEIACQRPYLWRVKSTYDHNAVQYSRTGTQWCRHVHHTDETLWLLPLMVYYISCYKAMGDSVQCIHPTKSIQFRGGAWDLNVLVELPFSIVKGAHLSGLQPSGDTMEVEGVVAHTPCHCTFLASCRGLVGLTLYACTIIRCFWSSFLFRNRIILEKSNLHKSMMWFRQMAQLSTTMSM